jgi:hypothetical protein
MVSFPERLALACITNSIRASSDLVDDWSHWCDPNWNGVSSKFPNGSGEKWFNSTLDSRQKIGIGTIALIVFRGHAFAIGSDGNCGISKPGVVNCSRRQVIGRGWNGNIAAFSIRHDARKQGN